METARHLGLVGGFTYFVGLSSLLGIWGASLRKCQRGQEFLFLPCMGLSLWTVPTLKWPCAAFPFDGILNNYHCRRRSVLPALISAGWYKLDGSGLAFVPRGQTMTSIDLHWTRSSGLVNVWPVRSPGGVLEILWPALSSSARVLAHAQPLPPLNPYYKKTLCQILPDGRHE